MVYLGMKLKFQIQNLLKSEPIILKSKAHLPNSDCHGVKAITKDIKKILPYLFKQDIDSRCIVISDSEYLSVTMFNKNMENFFKNESTFKNVYVKGEVSGTYISAKKHLYFTLKDKRSEVPCIVYNWFRKSIGFEIENGMKLLVTANVSVYWPKGKYQLDVRSATDEGIGKLTIAYEQLKRKLRNEGLFDYKHKKALPEYPKRIGVVTSKGGSVIHDILKIVKRDWPYCHVLLFPAAVQGSSSKEELVTQIKNADEYKLDVLIVGRGGGSLEELWSFNEECVVRAIFECKTPVISAIGHEDNTTLSDLVADKRASTPTMAASLAIKNKRDVFNNVSHLNRRLMTFISSKVDKNKKDFENLLKKAVLRDPSNVYSIKHDSFDLLCNRFNVISKELIHSNIHELAKIKSSYSIRHPCKIQVDLSKSKLNELKTRLIDVMNFIMNNYRVNLDKIINEFNFQSDKLIASQRHRLESIRKSYLIVNPCIMQLDSVRSQLKTTNDKLNNSMDKIYNSNEYRYAELKNRFKSQSNEMILTHTYELNLIKTSPALKNPLKNHIEKNDHELNNLYSRLENSFNQTIKDNQNSLNVILDKNIIKNPYLMLDQYRSELNKYGEKLDKINKVNLIELEKQKEKARLMKTIVAIVVVFMIIILLLMFGGI